MSEFSKIEALYDAAEFAAEEGWQIYLVSWPEFSRFHAALGELEAALKQYDLTDRWEKPIGAYRRFRYLLATTPLRPSRILDRLAAWLGYGLNITDGIQSGTPHDVIQIVQRLGASFNLLLQRRVSPLWECALQHCCIDRTHPGAELAVLFRDTRLQADMRDILIHAEDTLKGLSFTGVRPKELKELNTYHQLLVFGPAAKRWDDGSDFVFKSPRASLLTLFLPDVYRPNLPAFNDLYGPAQEAERGSGSIARFSPPTIESWALASNGATNSEVIEGPSAYSPLQANDLAEPFPEYLIDYQPSEDPGSHSDGEDMPARQFILSADHLVYLPQSGFVYRIITGSGKNAAAPVCESIESIPIDEVTPGDILLFTEAGAGDDVYRLANELLGSEAKKFRELQLAWKRLLFEKVRNETMDRVVSQLKRQGVSNASEQNVRNWCSRLNIGPGSRKNFTHVLEICGLGDHGDEIFRATRAIRGAHVKAGYEASKKLITSMKQVGLDELYADGIQCFGGAPGMPAQKTAYFVQGIASKPFRVQPWDLAKPIPIDTHFLSRWVCLVGPKTNTQSR